MSLRDRLDEALRATPPDNTARLATLAAVKAACGAGSDGEVQTAIAAIIAEREQKAGSYSAAGQSDLARAERAEIDALRKLLRSEATPPPAAPVTPKKAQVATPVAEEPVAAKPLLGRNQLILGLVAVVVAFIAGYFVFGGGSDKTKTDNAAVVVSADDRVMGNPNASVVLLEYAAPSCPHCARLNATIMPKIKLDYVDTGKVFYIFRSISLNPADGAVEGIARKCLPTDKYFQFIDLMFRNQPKWDPDGYKIDDVGGAIKQMARIMGVSPEEADRCMTDPVELERINKVGEEAFTKYKVTHTPTLIINGTTVEETEMSWPALKAKLDSLLSKK
jgi:protein-disulfide isomerase